VLWVADGPGAGARFRAFDLRYELGGEGARATPPADLPADPELDASVARRVRLARAALRDARRAQHLGDADRARELVQRALAYAPRLPEALRLAGDLARAAGDRNAASRYYERFLDAVPDDLGAEAEVRAILGR
jgi:tetratricopeptide (TPR) repeat protein